MCATAKLTFSAQRFGPRDRYKSAASRLHPHVRTCVTSPEMISGFKALVLSTAMRVSAKRAQATALQQSGSPAPKTAVGKLADKVLGWHPGAKKAARREAENAALPKNLPKTLDKTALKFLRANPKLEELKAGHQDFSTTQGYNPHKAEYQLPVSSADFINAIATSKPEDLWNGTAKYQMSYDRNTGKTYGPGDAHPPIGKGQVFILELKLTSYFSIPVCFEVVDCDPKNGRFAFSYVTKNKSQGIQQLQLQDNANGSNVVHETRFKSNDEFRDKHLYVPFHEKMLKEFYESVGKKLEAQNK